MKMDDDMERAKVIAENTEGLSQEARSAGIMGALMGISNESVIHGMVSVQDSISSKEATAKTKKPPCGGLHRSRISGCPQDPRDLNG